MATHLAKQILEGGPDAGTALRQAIRAAGFGVREADGSILLSMQPGRPLVFQHWELDAMLKMSANRMTIPFSDFSAGLIMLFPELERTPVGDLLLEGIRTQMHSNIPIRRFWARFILALGRESPEPHNLLKDVTLSEVHLDVIQFAMILQQLADDLRFYSAGAQVKRSSSDSSEYWSRTTSADGALVARPYVVGSGLVRGAVMRGEKAEVVKVQQEASRPLLPSCLWDQPWWIPTPDELALGYGVAFGEAMDWLEDKAPEAINPDKKSGFMGTAKAARLMATANVLLAYAKLAWIWAALDVDLSMDGEGPLVCPDS